MQEPGNGTRAGSSNCVQAPALIPCRIIALPKKRCFIGAAENMSHRLVHFQGYEFQNKMYKTDEINLFLHILLESSIYIERDLSRFQTSCYIFLNDSKSWNDARVDCISRGGNLVSILVGFGNFHVIFFVKNSQRFGLQMIWKLKKLYRQI